MPLTDEQQQAFEMVKNKQISIISGGPGCGKTFLLKEILPWAESKGYSIACTAPTGKASHQISKATGRPASTIHRLLKPMYDETTGNFNFKHNEYNPLNIDFLVIDESSMLDLSLMASVMDAIDTNKTSILLIGDNFQLPSVSPGAVLRDLINSKVVPCTELIKVQRNSGDIVAACHLIKDGKYYTPSPKIDLDNGLNLRHVPMKGTTRIKNFIGEIVCDRMPAKGYDPIRDVQVLSPVNKRGDLSCDSLNEMLQEKLNPNPAIKNTKFRIDSKIIYTKNSKVRLTTGGEAIVLNGDMGYVIDIPGKQMILRFENPRRDVAVPLKNKDVRLAHALTIHRSQGSEFPVVIIPVHTSFGYFTSRSLIYTAISRGSELVITIGEFEAIRQAIDNNTANVRKTRLTEKLQRREK